MRTRRVTTVTFLALGAALLYAGPLSAQSTNQDGKLHIHVSPKQAYVFVDGKAIRDGSQTIELQPGTHKVGVYNYGYLSKTQDVQIESGKKTELNVALQESGDKVSGPFADIEFKGHPRAAVLLNGTTPEYFVGHVDEFDWNWIWHQRLLVKPGTYQVTVTREGNTIWSGQVTAKAGQQVTVHLDHNGTITTKDWNEGLTMGPQPRFHAGVASATVPIALVTAQLSAKNTEVGCGQSTDLNWKTADAASISISDLGTVPASGEPSVSPMKNTTYELTAIGPGGKVTQDVAVKVDIQPTATISLSQPEVHYHKIGDKVVQQDSATLTWSTSNANSVIVGPLDDHATSGTRVIEAQPKQTSVGPVNENAKYTLTSANSCGGTTMKTATLHITGSIDPPPAITIASVFYPTDYPRRKHPEVGLVASEARTLTKLAANFDKYADYKNGAKLKLVAHADVRGSKKYNQVLTERRAERVKSYLLAHGVSADKIDSQAMGKDQQLDRKQVQALLATNPAKAPKWMMRDKRATWLAYNRRVDIVLEPEGQQSTELYPDGAPDARILWSRKEPSLKTVEAADQGSASVQQARASSSDN
jgi:OmpA family protein/PEGA domain-containing protein